MKSPEQKAAQLVEFEQVKQAFVQRMGLGPLDSIDDWIREGLVKLKMLNGDVQGDVLRRCSLQTKTRVLRGILDEFGVQTVNDSDKVSTLLNELMIAFYAPGVRAPIIFAGDPQRLISALEILIANPTNSFQVKIKAILGEPLTTQWKDGTQGPAVLITPPQAKRLIALADAQRKETR